MSEINIPPVTDPENGPPENGWSTLVYVIGSASVVLVGALAAGVVVKTSRLSYANIGHLLLTKGKVWEPSRFRNGLQ